MARRTLFVTVPDCPWRADGLCCYRIITSVCGPNGEIVLPACVPKCARRLTVRQMLAHLPKTSPAAKDIKCDALNGKPCRHDMPPATPRYDRQLRMFFVGPFMLLRFKRLAQNEAGVLEAFQDENWPARVELEIPSELDPVHKTNDAVFDSSSTAQVRMWLPFNGL